LLCQLVGLHERIAVSVVCVAFASASYPSPPSHSPSPSSASSASSATATIAIAIAIAAAGRRLGRISQDRMDLDISYTIWLTVRGERKSKRASKLAS